MNARKKRQIDAELAMMGMQATDGPGQYVTVQIEGPDGPEVYKVWACEAEAPRTRRHNPPLSEHMEHNKLEDIAELLATRIIDETMTGRNGVFIVGDFIYELCIQIRIQLRDAGVEELDDGFAVGDDRALNLLTASEKVRSLFKGNGPLARMFPQHVGRSVR